MCGRYASTRSDDDLSSIFDAVVRLGDPPEPSYNVAPTDPVRIVLDRDDDRQLRTVRWGLVPSWAKDKKIASRLINARSETVTEKPAFRKAAARRRCLIPADGYYEWEKREGAKVPHFLHTDGVLAMAGLYELWPDPSLDDDDPNKWFWSTTVLTTTATDALGHIHDRSPVVVPDAQWADWLDPELTDLGGVADLLASLPEPHLTPYEVSTAVNNVRNNGPELLAPV
ncbi:SOS response-associated peptidase [Rhodococcoides corynebacterioides]|uniref:Abasic site processing protein n=1 Tax=Rhodococcoides corynebacterioides TaxID=53972 RepID=A0ABS7P6N7_9NOCA|nr:SOS response-associated peptidase [Rhodococcus corynebacterioides]MBY6368086.1 SOS response-associated peptidase [Rhodococcus corynebacterioides]MBY6406530.1 SOS response-associated peptidase [Rhodococcus corynebacterioides]